MTLPAAQWQPLQQEILDVCSTLDDLRQLAQFALGQNLFVITTADGLAAQAFNLISWADSKGCITELQAAVAQRRQDHPLPNAPFLVSYERNPLFVGREADLTWLDEHIGDGPTPALVGTGGLGKTQLAVEFAYRTRARFPGGIFWLTMDTPENARSAVVASGGPLGMNLPGWDALDYGSKIAAVQSAWQSPDARLLIFDNCEDEAVLTKWRPRIGGSRVLVTSRRYGWSKSQQVAARQLEVLSLAESIALLRQHRPDLSETDPDLKAIAEELGCLPLTLHLAGYFLDSYSETPTNYLRQIRSPDLLKHRSLQQGDLSPTDHDQNVERTFLVSYNRLNPDTDATDKLAMSLLVRAAYFAPGEAIPTDLLLPTLQLPADDPNAKYQAKDGLKRLTDVGLIEPMSSTALRLHRLLAFFVLEIEQEEEAQSQVEEVLIRIAYKLNEEGLPRDALLYLPHLRHVATLAKAREDEKVVVLLSNLALILQSQGDYKTARAIMERALEIAEVIGGPNHPQTAGTLNNLASLLYAQGDYNAALPLYERVVPIYEQTYGPSHPQTAIILNNLAELRQEQGDYSTARLLYERALKIHEQASGPHDAQTANSLNKLALLLQAQGEYNTAQPLYERALAIRETVYGPTHPKTAISLSSLAFLLQEQGDYDKAHQLHERALAIVESAFGPHHPETARNLNNLAEVLQAQRVYKSAQPLYERALSIYEQIFGAIHPHIATILSNLAGVLQAQGDYSTARSLLERSLAIDEAIYGTTHPKVGVVLNNLAGLLFAQKDYTAARPLYERALTLSESTLGPVHLQTASTLDNLATLLFNQGDLAGAYPLLVRVLPIYRQHFGPQHLTTQRVEANLATLQRALH